MKLYARNFKRRWHNLLQSTVGNLDRGAASSIPRSLTDSLNSPIGCMKLSQDVLQASKLPEIRATRYRAMYANGMHLRIRSAKEEKVTCDSAVASAV
jgi:hypothetical protein